MTVTRSVQFASVVLKTTNPCGVYFTCDTSSQHLTCDGSSQDLIGTNLKMVL